MILVNGCQIEFIDESDGFFYFIDKLVENTPVMRILLFLISFNLVAATTNSERFKEFDSQNEKRDAFVLEEIKKINKRISKSPNRRVLEKRYKAKYHKERVLGVSKTYKLIDPGLGKPQLLIKENNGKRETIFDAGKISRNGSYTALSMAVSPQEKYAAISFKFKGSIDEYSFVIVDLENRKPTHENLIKYKGQGLGLFFVNDEWVYADDEYIQGYRCIDVREKDNTFSSYNFSGQADGWIHLVAGDKSLFTNGKEQRTFVGNPDVELMGVRDNSIYLFSNESNADALRSVFIKLNEKGAETVFEVENLFEEPQLLKSKIISMESLGHSRSVYVLDLNTKSVKSAELPEYVTLTSGEENDDGIEISLSSDLVSNEKVLWKNDSSEPLFPANFKSKMHLQNGFEIVSDFIHVESFDGTQVPVKMVYAKGTMLKDAAVYMEAYGGFNSSNHIVPVLGYFNLDFIRNGGVFIGAGVRGGNEYGPRWHEGARLDLKHKTFEDLASIAKWLIDSKITTKEKIVIAGSSNGGLTVAATGLLYPEYFGLVIPHNGVLDMLGKEYLDEEFYYGWSYEYGDSRTPKYRAYLEKISPLELVKNLENGPKFLVLNGRTDSRVNSAHSIKLVAAAKEIPNSNIDLLSVNNSGHFNTSPRYDDYIAWWVEVVKWTTIYDHLGIVVY